MDTEYALAKDLSSLTITDLLKDFMIREKPSLSKNAVSQGFEESLNHWLEFFKDSTINDFSVKASKSK